MPDYRETVEKLRKALARQFAENDEFIKRSLADALALLTEQEAELATLRQEITDLRSGPLSSWSQTVGILGGDEYDLGPELAKQRMDELATLRAENDKLRVENAALGWTVNPEGMGR